jgi:hypothetical protein
MPVPAGRVRDLDRMVKSSASVAVPGPARLSTMVCACSKVEPEPVLTVNVADPPASPMLAASTVKLGAGASSSSPMVTVTEPTPAVSTTASSGSSIRSWMAVSVVPACEALAPTPAGRVSVVSPIV